MIRLSAIHSAGTSNWSTSRGQQPTNQTWSRTRDKAKSGAVIACVKALWDCWVVQCWVSAQSLSTNTWQICRLGSVQNQTKWRQKKKYDLFSHWSCDFPQISMSSPRVRQNEFRSQTEHTAVAVAAVRLPALSYGASSLQTGLHGNAMAVPPIKTSTQPRSRDDTKVGTIGKTCNVACVEWVLTQFEISACAWWTHGAHGFIKNVCMTI